DCRRGSPPTHSCRNVYWKAPDTPPRPGHLFETENLKRTKDRRPPRQEFALNLSAKRRLCNTVGKRFIDGTARCCVVSTARSRAAATTNLARSICAGSLAEQRAPCSSTSS